MIEVVAALIRKNDTFLICQRPRDKRQGLMWEFVGGKVETNESHEQALIRECKEELDVTILPHDVYTVVEHSYPYGDVRLTLFNAEIVSGDIKLIEHEDMRWITAKEIPSFEFCPADRVILEKLSAEAK